MSKKIVYLIGAGPGDPGLITVRGLQLLRASDAVVHDHLVPDELVVSLSDSVERYYVGKQAGQHTLSQDEINELIVRLASEGKTVARLKGGDPFIFGRGGEEARYLREHGIPFVIVPGVTAGVAGPAYGGIPCTDREKSSFVMFATGHKAGDKEQTSVPWDWVGKASGGTIVVYMGVGEMENIVSQLINSGMSPDTPAAMVERGTFPTQRVVSATLKNLPDKAKSEGIKPPALTIIGDVVDLEKQMQWIGDGPLFGIRVLVTRPADQAEELYNTLRDLGAEVLPYPTIATREHEDATAWERIEAVAAAKQWLVFTSENGIRYFMKQFVSHIGDIRRLGNVKIAVVGEGTARALKQFALMADFIPTKATTVELARQMVDRLDLSGATVIRVQGNLSDDTVEKTLIDAGADVIPLTVYETYRPDWPGGFKAKLLMRPPDVIMFSSGSTVDGFCHHVGEDERRQVTEHATIVSIGPMTSRRLKEQGLNVTLEAKVHSIPAMVEEMVEYFKEHPFKR